MTLRDPVAWLPPALLLLQVPGSFPVSGPSTVNGTVGGSLSVQCRYEEKFQANNKFWCRGSFMLLCDEIVGTTHSKREVRRSQVSISDHPASLSFTVTMEGLTLEDAGAYLCGVDTPWHPRFDPTFRVRVFVPAPTTASSPVSSTGDPGPPTSLSAHTRPSTSSEDTPGPSPQPRSLLSSLHFLVLVFVEVPLLLSMLSAILWVNRPLSPTGGRRSRGDYGNQ